MTLSAMHIATPLTGTRYGTVLRQALALVRAGDYRARRITLTGAPGVFADRTAIVTPHRDNSGKFDADDFAAQLYALAHGIPSDTATYTDGYFVRRGTDVLGPGEAYEIDWP
ncbi:hypothetical protein BFG51_01210 [Dietzia alimentaria]|nr:hypothetical protein BFG51_01210 [Dietzia alimentaria]